MDNHPKIEAIENQRDLLASASRGLATKIEEAREDLNRALAQVDECAGNHLASESQKLRAIADRDRLAQRLDLLRNRRKTIDADRARCGQVVERLSRWWKANGGAA